MGDLLVPFAPFVVASASTFPAFHIFREFSKIVLKPIVPYPSKTIPQPTQSTPSTLSTTFDDDGRWFPTSLFATVPPPAFTPEQTPFAMLPKAAAPVKNLDHLPNVLSTNPTRATIFFVFIVTTYLFIQFFARHIQLRRRFSPVTHIASTAITIYIYTLIGPASHDALLNMPVTLQQVKESVLPVACATLATFSMSNMLVSVLESVIRNVLAGIEVSAFPDNMKPHLQSLVLLAVLAPTAYRSHQINNGLVPFEVTVRREIESSLASVDPRFVAMVTMAFVALCVMDMLLGFLQWCNISLLGFSLSTLTCGPVVLAIRIFQALAYVVFRPFRWLTDASSTRGTHQDETGLADATQLSDARELIKRLEDQISNQQTDLGKYLSAISQHNRRIKDDARSHSRQLCALERELKSTARDRDAKITKLESRIAKLMDYAEFDKKTIEKLRSTQRPHAGAGVQTLPVVFDDNALPMIVPALVVEKAEIGVQIDQVAQAPRVLAERSVQVKEVPRHLVDVSTEPVQHNPVLVDSVTQTIDTPQILIDLSAQVQEPPRQVTETAVQAAEPARVFADSPIQTGVLPPTVYAAEYKKALMELEELRGRLQDIESKPEAVDITQAEEVPSDRVAHDQDGALIQLPNGGPKVSVQALATFLGVKLNQAFASRVAEGEEEESAELEAEENLHTAPTGESSLAPMAVTTAPIPNVSPEMYATYEAISGKKFVIPDYRDIDKLDQMPLRQWIMTMLQRLYIERLPKHSDVITSQVSGEAQGLNTAATRALGQGNYALMVAMWQLSQAHTLSKLSPEEMVKGLPAPAYVTVDWKWKKPMDDDRIGQSFYKLQRHVLDAIRDKSTPNPFVVSALNLMEFSIAYAERLYADIKEPDWFKNSSNPHIRQARLWIKHETGVWIMDEDLIALAELIQTEWELTSSFKRHLKFNAEEEPGYALLRIKRGMELEVSVAEEAGEQPLAEAGEKKLKKRSDGRWGHEMAHYGNQVGDDHDEPSVDESVDENEEAEVEAEIKITPEPRPVTVRPQLEVMAPPVNTQTIQPLEESEPEPGPVKAVEPDSTTTYQEEKGKGKDPALVQQSGLTEAEEELGPATIEPTPNFSWDDELTRQPTTSTQPPSQSFHGRGNNRGVPLQIETEYASSRPAPTNAPPSTTDTQTSFTSGLMASRHAPRPTGSMASMHAPRPTGLSASMHAPSSASQQPTGTMASMHAPRPTGLHASMHAPSSASQQPTGTMASMHAPKPTGSMASMHAPRPSASPVIDRNRSMHADDPSSPGPSPGRPNGNRRNRGRGYRLGSHQIN